MIPVLSWRPGCPTNLQRTSNGKQGRLSLSATQRSYHARRETARQACLADEVLGALAHGRLGRELQVHLQDALVCVAVPLSLEWRHAEEELRAQMQGFFQ